MSFKDWLSGDNNPSLPRSEFLYGTKHLILLAIVIFLSITLSIILKNKSFRTKQLFFRTCALIFLIFEILQRVLNLIFLKSFTVESVTKIILPLYFCSVAVVFFIIAIALKKQALINAAAILALLVTTAYLVYPAVGLNKKYLSFSALYSISSHALGFVVSLLTITTRYVTFDIKKIWQTYVIFSFIILYGLLTSLVLFPGNDYLFMLVNPLPFDFGIPYTIVFFIFLILYIASFYLIELFCKKMRFKKLNEL